MVNPDRPWPRSSSPARPLDPTASETLELWCAQPEFDTRSLEEFAAEGGRPVGPPNRMEGGPGILAGFFAFAWGLPLLAWRAARWALELLDFRRSSIDHALERGRFYELPPRLELRPLAPAPPPPSTPMLTGYLRSSLPRAPIGGTGETRGRGMIIIDDPTLDPAQVLELNRRREAGRPETGGGWPT